jgi:hypothetical protein
VIGGMLLTAGSNPVIRIDLDTKIVERGVELTLAILLFADATVVPGSILRRERRVLTRLLVIALPLPDNRVARRLRAVFPARSLAAQQCWRSSWCRSIWRRRSRSSAIDASLNVFARS